ncbi:uncharacterized protein LOC143276666 [Babylonia areolata]|uniref:uncharacterized protein LOC143276666 n=1 Tax=Babylonia areolata TaxID=304850 RepID=UPI003FD0D39B
MAATTAEDDGIEILSCHIEEDPEEVGEEDLCTETTSTTTATSARFSNGRTVLVERGSRSSGGEAADDDPVSKHRKRVARVVAVVTFVLLLFSVVLIGVSLTMSKNIDEMALSNNAGKAHIKPPTPKVKVINSTHLGPDLESDLQMH